MEREDEQANEAEVNRIFPDIPSPGSASSHDSYENNPDVSSKRRRRE